MLKRAAVSALFLGLPLTSIAADVFSVTATVGAQTNSKGFTTAGETFDSLQQQNLTALVPTYTGIEVANVAVDFRGLPLSATYIIVADPTLVLNIPSLGITRTFVGATREDSGQQLRDFFKNGDVLGRIMRELAKTSPVDPIAGNPNSLQARMIAGDFERNFSAFATTIKAPPASRTSLRERPLLFAANEHGGSMTDSPGAEVVKGPNVGLGLGLGAYRQAGLRTVSTSLSSSYAFPSDPERAFSVNANIALSDAEGAKSYGLGFGAAYRFRMSDRWYLTPSASYGLTGSEDLGSLGQIIAGTLTSAYRIHQDDRYTLWMGNSINHSQTLRSSIAGYSFDPDIANTAFINGLVLSMPLAALGGNYSIDYSFTDTRYTGTALYNDRYDEVGVAIGTSKSVAGTQSYLRAGLSYITSPHSEGFLLNFLYSF